MSLLMKDHALLVKLFYKDGDCAQAALKKFRVIKEYDGGMMSAKGLKKVNKKFKWQFFS